MISIVSAYVSQIKTTIEFLENMQSKTRGMDVEMILVNGGGRKIHHQFISRRIDLHNNIGFSATVNAGLSAAYGEWTLFASNDCFPDRYGWLQGLLDIQKQSLAWMVCPANDNPGMDYRSDSYNFYHDEYDYWLAEWFPMMTFLMNTGKRLETGLFDEGYLRSGQWSDNDYCARIRARGGTIAVSKHILVKHIGGCETKALSGTQEEDFNQGAARFSKRLPMIKKGLV